MEKDKNTRVEDWDSEIQQKRQAQAAASQQQTAYDTPPADSRPMRTPAGQAAASTAAGVGGNPASTSSPASATPFDAEAKSKMAAQGDLGNLTLPDPDKTKALNDYTAEEARISRAERNLRRNRAIEGIANALASVANLHYTTKGAPSMDESTFKGGGARERLDKLEKMRTENYERYRKAYKEIEEMSLKREQQKALAKSREASARLASLRAQLQQETNPLRIRQLRAQVAKAEWDEKRAAEAVDTQAAQTAYVKARTDATTQGAADRSANAANLRKNRTANTNSQIERRDTLNAATRKEGNGGKAKKSIKGFGGN